MIVFPSVNIEPTSDCPLPCEHKALFLGRAVDSVLNTPADLSTSTTETASTQVASLSAGNYRTRRVNKCQEENARACQLMGMSIEDLASISTQLFLREINSLTATQDDKQLVKRCRNRFRHSQSAASSRYQKKRMNERTAIIAKKLERENIDLKRTLSKMQKEYNALMLTAIKHQLTPTEY